MADSIYTNHTEMSLSSWDMRIRFSEVLAIEEGQQLLQEKVVVVMSLHHAKAFVKMFQEELQEFEKHHGEIHLISK